MLGRSVAHQEVSAALHAPVSGLQWVVDAYILVIACLVMFSGSVADRFGRRRVFQAGLGVFSLGSLLCGLAPSLPALVAFRALQAVGDAMLNPVAMSIIASTFTDSKERVRAVGAWGAVAGLGGACGPVGGLLVSGLGIDPVAGAVKAATLLRPGGRLALFWNVGDPAPEIAHAFAEVYRSVNTGLPFTPWAAPALDGYETIMARAIDGDRQHQRVHHTHPAALRLEGHVVLWPC